MQMSNRLSCYYTPGFFVLSYTVRGEGERRFNRHLTRLRNVLTTMPVEVFPPHLFPHLPGKGMALLPSPSPKNRACCFHRTRLKHFKRPLRRTRYSNRSFLRDQSAGAIAYDRLDASPPDWPSNRHHRSPPRHGDASASRFPG